MLVISYISMRAGFCPAHELGCCVCPASCPQQANRALRTSGPKVLERSSGWTVALLAGKGEAALHARCRDCTQHCLDNAFKSGLSSDVLAGRFYDFSKSNCYYPSGHVFIVKPTAG